MHLRQFGGLAALLVAAASLVGLLIHRAVLVPGGYGNPANDILVVLGTNGDALYLREMVEYVVRGLLLVVLAVALEVRLRPFSPNLARVALVFGVIWVSLLIISGLVASVTPALVLEQAALNREYAIDLYTSLTAIVAGLHTGDIVLGGLWLALISYAALRAGLSRLLSYFGMAVGVAGLCPIAPPLIAPGSTVFTVGSIAWFICVGVVLLLREPTPQPRPVRATRIELPSANGGFPTPGMSID